MIGPGGLPPQPSSYSGGGEAGALDAVRQMLSLADQYLIDEPDPEDAAVMRQIQAGLHSLLTKDQHDMQQQPAVQPPQGAVKLHQSPFAGLGQ